MLMACCRQVATPVNLFQQPHSLCLDMQKPKAVKAPKLTMNIDVGNQTCNGTVTESIVSNLQQNITTRLSQGLRMSTEAADSVTAEATCGPQVRHHVVCQVTCGVMF